MPALTPTPPTPPSPPPRWRRKHVVLALVLLALSGHALTSRSFRRRAASGATSSARAGAPPLPPPRTAEEIVRRSYRRTFGALPTDARCGPGVAGAACVDALLAEVMARAPPASDAEVGAAAPPSPGKASSSFPWWFVTLLRDLQRTTSVHGRW